MIYLPDGLRGVDFVLGHCGLGEEYEGIRWRVAVRGSVSGSGRREAP